MSRFSKRKIAATLAFASIFGGKASAAQTNKIPQSSMAASRSISKNRETNKGFINWVKNHKLPLAIGGGAIVIAAAATATFFGVKHSGKNPNGGNNEQTKIEENEEEKEQLENNIEQVGNEKNGGEKKGDIKPVGDKKDLSLVEDNLLNSFLKFFQEGNYIFSEGYRYGKNNILIKKETTKQQDNNQLEKIIKIMGYAKEGYYNTKMGSIKYNVSFDSKDKKFKITGSIKQKKVPDFEYEIFQDSENKDIWHINHQLKDGYEIFKYGKKSN